MLTHSIEADEIKGHQHVV